MSVSTTVARRRPSQNAIALEIKDGKYELKKIAEMRIEVKKKEINGNHIYRSDATDSVFGNMVKIVVAAKLDDGATEFEKWWCKLNRGEHRVGLVKIFMSFQAIAAYLAVDHPFSALLAAHSEPFQKALDRAEKSETA